jgi:hypothetical protein
MGAYVAVRFLQALSRCCPDAAFAIRYYKLNDRPGTPLHLGGSPANTAVAGIC